MSPPRPARPRSRELQLRLVDFRGDPMRFQTGVLDWGSELGIPVATNAAGLLGEMEDGEGGRFVSAGVRIPLAPDAGVLRIDAFRKAPFFVTINVVITNYGDASTPQGASARLHNLGFLHLPGRDAGALSSALDATTIRALNRFQTANRLPVTSVSAVANDTRDRLADAHDTDSGRLGKV